MSYTPKIGLLISRAIVENHTLAIFVGFIVPE
jgi:hypothetical protein